MTTTLRLLAVNLAGVVETPALGGSPYAVAMDGSPYLPVGDGGVTLDVRLGDSVFAHEADHAAPGVTLVHPDQSARHGLTSFACAGNDVLVRTGAAAGERGKVLGKRGEAGRVIAVFEPEVLAAICPGDSVVVRGFGQGAALPAPLAAAGAIQLNVDPALLPDLGVEAGSRLRANVRAALSSKLIGNGIGRPAQQWDLDLSVTAATAQRWGVAELCIGDLVAVRDLDVRHNAGYRAGWTTIAVIVHGASRLPGHGPGLMPVLCAPNEIVDLDLDASEHRGVTMNRLGFAHG
jgi:hypothetical protein